MPAGGAIAAGAVVATGKVLFPPIAVCSAGGREGEAASRNEVFGIDTEELLDDLGGVVGL